MPCRAGPNAGKSRLGGAWVVLRFSLFQGRVSNDKPPNFRKFPVPNAQVAARLPETAIRKQENEALRVGWLAFVRLVQTTWQTATSGNQFVNAPSSGTAEPPATILQEASPHIYEKARSGPHPRTRGANTRCWRQPRRSVGSQTSTTEKPITRPLALTISEGSLIAAKGSDNFP